MTDTFPKEDLLATMRCQGGALLPCKLDWPIHRLCYWTGSPCDTRPAGAIRWSDAWGVTWQKESGDPAMMPFPIAHPLDARLDGLDRMTWPDPTAPELFADLTNIRCPLNRLLMGEHPFALYERAWLLAGMQNVLTAMVEAPDRVDALFARVGAFEEVIADRYIELGVEAAWIADDYGMNSALSFSPEMWRRFVRPHLHRVVDRYHAAGAVVILHSCGNVTPLVDELLAVGVDVLDPLQPRCNELESIRERTAGRMCLCGGVEASVLLAGDTAQTMTDTHCRIAQLGADGGYIVGPDDEWGFPAPAHDAMLAAVEHYRGLARRGGRPPQTRSDPQDQQEEPLNP